MLAYSRGCSKLRVQKKLNALRSDYLANDYFPATYAYGFTDGLFEPLEVVLTGDVAQVVKDLG